jgi:hypothetical protein
MFQDLLHRVGAIADLQSGKQVQNFISMGDVRAFSLPLAAGSTLDPVRRITVFLDVSAASDDGEVASGSDFRVIVPTPLGAFELEPAESTARVGEPVRCVLTWTVPEGLGWRSLDTLDLRLRDESGVALWVRFREIAGEPGTFALVNPKNGKLGPAAAPGSPRRLAGKAAALNLIGSAVDGPPGRVVTLTLELEPKRRAAGRTLDIEAAAVDDAGEMQQFQRGGGITVLPRRW